MLTEQVVLFYAETLFDTYEVESKCVVAVTRNAVSARRTRLRRGRGLSGTPAEGAEKARTPLPRPSGDPGRSGPGPDRLPRRRLELSPAQVFSSRAPLALGYVYALETLLPPETVAALCYPKYTPQWPRELVKGDR